MSQSHVQCSTSTCINAGITGWFEDTQIQQNITMTMMKFAVLVLSSLAIASAFAPTPQQARVSTQLAADRREILALGGILLAGLKNPAAETFKGRKTTKGNFIPGKGMRQHDESLIAGLKNPAAETFKGRKTTKGNFIPGKGMRQHDDSLLAGLKNPAAQTFKGGKMTKGNFIPGKGLHQHDDLLMAGLKNPAAQTFKGGKMTKGNFIPGKGLHQHDDLLA